MFSNFISGLDRPWFIHRKGYFAAKNSASKKQQYWHSLLILLMASSIGCFVSATAVETAVPVASKFPFESALLLRKILTTDSDKGPLVSLAKIACLVNEERGMHDLPNVSISRILNRSAQKHTVDQAQMHEMTHTGSDGSRPSQRVRRVGYNYRAVGECVAFGYETEEEVMRAWMNSPPHKAIILDRTYRELGIGYARSADSVPYWTMDFGMNDKSPTSNVTACPTEADMAMDEPEQINNLIPTATVTTTEVTTTETVTTTTTATAATTAEPNPDASLVEAQSTTKPHHNKHRHKHHNHDKKANKHHRNHSIHSENTKSPLATSAPLASASVSSPTSASASPSATHSSIPNTSTTMAPVLQCSPDCCSNRDPSPLIATSAEDPKQMSNVSTDDKSDDNLSFFNKVLDAFRSWIGKGTTDNELPTTNTDEETIDVHRVRQLLRLASTSHKGTSSVRDIHLKH